MSRLKSEQGCSSENCGSEPVVSSSYGSLPDTLASVACGLDLAAMESPTSIVASDVTNKDVTANEVAVKDATAEEKRPQVAVATESAFGSPASSVRTKRPTHCNSASKMSAPPRKPGPPRSSSIWETFRSRRVRVLLTLVGVLMIAGLVGLNMKGSNSSADTDDMELEMSEFGEGQSADLASTTGSTGAPAVFDQGFDNQPIGTADANPWETSPAHLPPLGLSPMNDSAVIPAGGMDRTSASGPRGAWLTGQIELESSGVVPVSGYRSSGFGRR